MKKLMIVLTVLLASNLSIFAQLSTELTTLNRLFVAEITSEQEISSNDLKIKISVLGLNKQEIFSRIISPNEIINESGKSVNVLKKNTTYFVRHFTLDEIMDKYGVYLKIDIQNNGKNISSMDELEEVMLKPLKKAVDKAKAQRQELSDLEDQVRKKYK